MDIINKDIKSVAGLEAYLWSCRAGSMEIWRYNDYNKSSCAFSFVSMFSSYLLCWIILIKLQIEGWRGMDYVYEKHHISENGSQMRSQIHL